MELFLEYFDKVMDNSGAVKKLREFILNLAMQGKLVPQDPDEEPSSELLKRIKAEKAQLIKERKLKSGKELPPIKPVEIPYPIPDTWTWCRLGDISHNLGQKKPDREFLYVDVTSVNKQNGINWDSVQSLMPEDAPSRARKIVNQDCVIYSTVRPYLQNITLIDNEAQNEIIVSTAFAVLKPYTGISKNYLYHYLFSPVWSELTSDKMRGMAYPAINDADLQKLLIPIPPLSEQNRIVEKVNNLMHLCDELKSSIEHSKDLNDRLLKATLREALTM